MTQRTQRTQRAEATPRAEGTEGRRATKPAHRSPPHSASPANPDSVNSKSVNPGPAKPRSLWDISDPQEVAQSILAYHASPLTELRRREKFARRQKDSAANLRFWAEVEIHIRSAPPPPTGRA